MELTSIRLKFDHVGRGVLVGDICNSYADRLLPMTVVSCA